MNDNRKITLLLLCGLLANSEPVSAHIGTDSDAGILSNIIAVGIVVLSIVIYLLISNRKRKKTTRSKK